MRQHVLKMRKIPFVFISTYLIMVDLVLHFNRAGQIRAKNFVKLQGYVFALCAEVEFSS